VRFSLRADASHLTLAPELSPALRERLLATPAPSPSYTAIVFTTGSRPVGGKLAERALAAAASAHGPPFLVVAECYTQEALSHLRASNATIVGISDFVWTDESSAWVRAVSAAKSKAPDVRKR
jgi:hypothetical protein